MILAVCLNPALDITYRAGTVRRGSSHAVTVTGERAGGKGVNVARVLHQMQAVTMVTGLVGGARGAALAADLDAAGVRHSFSAISGQTRRSFAVIDSDAATVFNESGPCVSATEWREFLAHFTDLLGSASIVTLSGSTPPGLDTLAYAELVRLAGRASVPVILDAAGPVMRRALAERPTVVAPNRAEAAETLGRAINSPRELENAAAELRASGAGSVVISSGADGLVCHTMSGVWTAAPPAPIIGNPTGAGDAVTAALAAGLQSGESWPAMLRTAIAWSAGAVAAHCAGEIDERVATTIGDAVVLEELR